MENSLLDLLCPSLIPVLRSDVSAGPSGDVHRVLIAVPAVRALPDQLVVLVSDDHDLSVVSALLAVVALGVELRVHDVVINVLNDCQDRVDIVRHIRDFDIADRSARRQLLELGFEFQLREGVDLLCDMNMIAVRNIIPVCDLRDLTEALLQALRELIGRGLERCSVKTEGNVRLSSPLRALVIHELHDLQRKILACRICVGYALHILRALTQACVAERDRRIVVEEQLIDLAQPLLKTEYGRYLTDVAEGL